MPLEPLVAILLLVYLLMVAAVLTIWFALTTRRGRRHRAAKKAERAEVSPVNPPARPSYAASPPRRASNDEYRGARAKAGPKLTSDDDPFERFIRAKNDDYDL